MFESPLVLAISISLAILTLLILSLLLACLVRNRRGAKKPHEPSEPAEVRHTLICPPQSAAPEPLYSQKIGQPLPPPPTPVQWSLVYAGSSGQCAGGGATYTDSSHYEGNTYEVPRTHGAEQYGGVGAAGPSPAVSYARSHTMAGSHSSPVYGQQQQAAHSSPHSYGHSPSYSAYGGSSGAYRHADIY